MGNKIMNRGQVAIFIILGIVIVVGIVLMFLLMGEPDVGVASDLDPRDMVRDCVSDLVEISVEKMLANGGEVVASQAILYKGEEWNYLCYQADFYQGCYNIHPMLEMQIEKEIEKDTKGGVQECFDIMRAEFEARGFGVGGEATSYSVDLLPGYVEVSLSKKIDVSGEIGGSKSYENFGGRVMSPIYDLVRVAQDVVNSESQFCHFEYNGYMLLYPKFDIRRIDYMDSKIYRLIDRRSGKEFKFAVRSCAFAPGI